MKKIKDNRRGSTLVEVIVTFALIGMFLLAATTAVSAAMRFTGWNLYQGQL